MRDTRIFVAPTLCGCEVTLAADWTDADPEVGGKSYRHPIPGTITAVTDAHPCALHSVLPTTPLPADPYHGSPGYLKVPPSPTDDERFYIHLYRFGGQSFRPDTCGCRLYQSVDRLDPTVRRVVKHQRHTLRCLDHDDDDDDGTDALENSTRKSRLVARLQQQFPALAVEDISVTFTKTGPRQRRLTVRLPTLTNGQRQNLQTWVDANVGANKVTVTA